MILKLNPYTVYKDSGVPWPWLGQLLAAEKGTEGLPEKILGNFR